MFISHSNIIRHIEKQEKTPLSRDTPITEPDADMTQMVEVKDRIFKLTMINMMKALIEKVDNMHEQVENFNREMDCIRNNQMEILEIILIIINTGTEMKNAFHGLSSRSDTAM